MRILSLILALGLTILAGPARAQMLTPEQRIDALLQAIATKVTTKTLSVSGASNLVTLTVSGGTSLASLNVAGASTLGAVGASSLTLSTPLAVAQGGCGATTAAGCRTSLGLGGAALFNVGTSTGTVAAGDDGRIIGAAQNTAAAITGGSINGTAIGATTPSTGRFTSVTTTQGVAPLFINLVERGDWTIRFQNAAGNTDLGYIGTSGVVNGAPANSLRIANGNGIMLGDGLGINLWTAPGVVRSGYDNGTTLGAAGNRWSTTYSVLLNLTGTSAPSSSSDSSGAVGDVRLVGSTIYWKTSSGWVRTTGATF